VRADSQIKGHDLDLGFHVDPPFFEKTEMPKHPRSFF
jgi:hypothetical protein